MSLKTLLATFTKFQQKRFCFKIEKTTICSYFELGTFVLAVETAKLVIFILKLMSPYLVQFVPFFSKKNQTSFRSFFVSSNTQKHPHNHTIFSIRPHSQTARNATACIPLYLDIIRARSINVVVRIEGVVLL